MLDKTEWTGRLGGADCGVIGLGVSNLAVIDFLLSVGACVTAHDQKTREELGDVADRLASQGVRLALGEGYLDTLDEDVIFRAPAARPTLPAIERAVANGAVLCSEVELFMDLTPAHVIGITGSDGKTTTSTLTHLILEEERKKGGRGRVYLGGNIGSPLLPHVGEMTEDDIAVVELSSFQLQTMKRAPEWAAITNLSPNHLDWHTDMEEYINAKAHIFEGEGNARAVFNAENAPSVALARRHTGKKTFFSSKRHSVKAFEELLGEGDHAVFVRDGVIVLYDGEREHDYFPIEEILLPGEHNLENYMTAIALTEAYATPASVRAVAGSFRGVPHRMEWVREWQGVDYYNSSIDTTPSRTEAALRALPKKPIVICGGADKCTPYRTLAEILTAHAKAIVVTGATADAIEAALDDMNSSVPRYRVDDFDGAVQRARELAQSGDAVILSPACTSFDAFRNYKERGERFRMIVNQFKD